jgi:maltose alpha-D-glucosyltransferase/alpha-amylase
MSSDGTGNRRIERFTVAIPFGEPAIRAIADVLTEEFWAGRLPSFRWYGEKGREIASVATRVESVTSAYEVWIALAFLDVTHRSGPESTWFLPLVFERKPSVPALFAVLDSASDVWYAADGAAHPAFQSWLLESAKSGLVLELEHGSEARWNGKGLESVSSKLTGRLLTGEQSNSSIIYGNEVIAKVMRRVSEGLNPDVELGRYLTQDAKLQSVPALLADWSLIAAASESSLGIVQTFAVGATDGWNWLLEELKRAGSNPSRQASIVEAISDLGARTAELHMALAGASAPSLAPEQITAEDLTGWTRATLQLMDAVGDALARLAQGTTDRGRLDMLEAALQAWPLIGVGVVGHEASSGLPKIRVHGDYHLGQTLRQDDRWLIIDFEGEPGRSLSERRSRSSPLKDVAGMIRSIDYAKAMIVMEQRGWLDESNALNDAFIQGYREGITLPGLVPDTEEAFRDALKPWIIDKAMYEILYELNNRPEWLVVPIAALLRFTFMDDMGDYVARLADEP